MSSTLTTRFHSSLDEIEASAWNALLPDDNPFLDHAFLAGLERHGCLQAEQGWLPRHLGMYRGAALVAAAPMYVKLNSHGEYVFDWSWANAYARHGLDYYPKLLCAVPYSPVNGPRLLIGNGADPDSLRQTLIAAMQSETARHRWSSGHLNFCTQAEAHVFDGTEWLSRFDWQYHWHNRGWRDFDEFLGALKHKKRKNIRHERAQVAAAGVTCEVRHGGELDAQDWKSLHDFYLSTFDDKGNFPALTLDFFRHLGSAMPQHVVAVLCWRSGICIAGALMLRSSDTLYGRYWGCSEHVDGLHFEACYYQGIEYCLRHGLQRFEPGAQGQHKLARGFLPAMTRSFHWIADLHFRAAVRDALKNEASALRDHGAELMQHSPYTDRFDAGSGTAE